MKFLVACQDSGSIKEVICDPGTDTSIQSALQPISINTFATEGRSKYVEKLLVLKLKNDNEYLIAARKTGILDIYNINDDYKLLKRYNDLTQSNNDSFISLISIHNKLYTCSNEGKLSIINEEDIESEENINFKSIKLNGPVSSFVGHPLQEGIFAYGGKEKDVTIFSLFEPDSKKNINEFKYIQKWIGKNVKNDRLDLRVPIWITNIKFINLNNDFLKNGWELITTTHYGQIRGYNTKTSRKPIYSVQVSKFPFTDITNLLNEDEIICSDTHITVSSFNVKTGILSAKYPGSIGSIQSLYTFIPKTNEEKYSLLATGGLDKYLRVFNLISREQVSKVYIGTKISSVWVLSGYDIETIEKANKKQSSYKKEKRKQTNDNGNLVKDEESDEDVWDQLENLEKPKVKRRKA